MARWRRRRVEADVPDVEAVQDAFTDADVANMNKARKERVAAAAALLEGDVEPMEDVAPEPVPTPEYDAGAVDVEVLLEAEPAPSVDHHDVNVVVHEDLDGLDDPLERASIDGDLPQPVDLE